VSRGDSVVYVNGKYVEAGSAHVSVFDHGFLYGDGVFESLIIVDGRVFALDEHLERLAHALHTIRLSIPLTRHELRQAIVETARRNGVSEAYIRVFVTRGAGEPIMDPRAATAATIVIMVTPQSASAAGRRPWDRGLRVRTTAIRKTPAICVEARMKSMSFLNGVLARLEALDAGADDAVMLDLDNHIAEAPGSNIFAVHGEVVVTPPPLNILDGITRRAILRLSREAGLETAERAMSQYDLYSASEAFLSTTYGGVMPIAEVDGRTVGEQCPGPITVRLRDAYELHVRTSGVPIEPEQDRGAADRQPQFQGR
jgi:branched-chain amino acid aminotransferase